MTLTTCTITGSFQSADGTPATGSVKLRPFVSTPGSGQIITAKTIESVLVAGQLSAVVVSSAQVANLRYQITEDVDGAENPVAYGVDPVAPGIDLATAARSVTPPLPAASFVLSASLGAPSGVATLGSDGLLTASQRPASSGAVTTVAGRTGDVVLTKSDVGLSSVDNTADTAKPVSTAATTALGLKLNANDASVTNARTPIAHKTSHATGGSDALAPADIGAATASALTTETTRATTAEGTNATAIANEVTRATTAESTLTAAQRKSVFTAASIQLVACTGDPSTMPGSPGITSGRPYVHRVYADQSATATKMTMDMLSTGASTVASNVFMGVYSLAGALLAQTADLSSSFPASSTGSIINAALTSTLAAQALNTEFYLVFLGTFTGTAPTVVGGRQFGTNQTMASDARLYTNTSGSTLTALPGTLPALSQTSGFTQLFLGLGN